MPIYEYRCRACSGRFEALVARSDRTVPRCPQCGATRAERLISTFSVGRSRGTVAVGACGSSDGCASHACSCQRSNGEESP